MLGWLAAALLGGCATVKEYVKEPRVNLHEARVVEMSLADARLAFDVDIENPNPLAIAMQGLTYRLELADETLFQGTLDEGLRIAARDRSRVTLPFTLKYADVMGSLAALRGNDELKYRISGDAKFGPFAVPYSHAGVLPVPSLPEVTLDSLRIESLTLSGARLALGLGVRNTNRFPIAFSGLDYQLMLGDASVLRGQSNAGLSVAPNQAGTLRLALDVDYGQIAGLTQTLRQAGSLPVTFVGNVKVPGAGGDALVPYRWQGEVPRFR